MAQEIVGVKIQVDGSDVNKSIGQLRQEIAQTTAEVEKFGKKYGESSEQAISAQKRLDALQKQVNDKIEANNRLIDNAAKTVSALSAAYGGVQGALELTGLAGEDTIKQLAKIQSAIAIGDAIQNLAEFRSAITETFSTLLTKGKAAFNGLKAAIGSTGIGLLVVALGTIVAYWDDIKEAVSGVSEEQEALNTATKENLEAQKKKLDAIGNQDNILKLQGKSERDILKIKIAQTDEVIKAAEANVKNLKNQRDGQIAIAKRNKDILQGLIFLVTSPISAVLTSVDLIGKAVGKNFGLVEKFTGGLANLVFDPEKTAKEADNTIAEAEKGLTELKNQRAGYQLAINNIDKQASDKRKQESDKARQDQIKLNEKELERRKEDTDFEEKQILRRIKNFGSIANAQITQDQKVLDTQTAFAKAKEDLINRNISIDTKAGEQAIENIKKVGEANKKQYEEDIKLAEQKKEIQIGLAQTTLQAVSSFIDQNSVAGKAVAIAQAIINTYQGASKAIAQGGILGPVAAAATIAAGLFQVKKIVSTKIPSATGAGSVGTGSAPALAAAPIGLQGPQAQLTQLNQQSINQLGSATSRAYVVESDVTSSQDRQARINRAARIG